MPPSKQSALTAAKKAQTHLTKVVAMLERDAYCIDVLQQALAVQGLWKGMIRRIFENHLQTCFSDAVCHGNKSRQTKAIQEVIRVMELADRS